MAGAVETSILTPVAKVAVEEPYKILKGRFALSRNLEHIYFMFDQDCQQLLASKKDKEDQVRMQIQKVTTSKYRSWKTSVSNVAGKEENLRAKYERKQLPRWRIFRRASLSEDILKIHAEVKNLLEMERSIDIFHECKQPEAVLMELDVPPIAGYPTLQGALDEILDCLKTKKMRAIGVYGMKGVGKTAILKNLNNSGEVSQLFNMVIFITVPADQDAKKIQQLIADRLEIDIEAMKESFGKVATKIREVLRQKKFLLILDGVEDVINLQQLGIATENGSMVVMASHDLHVCNKNNIDRSIEVRILQYKEAWDMFVARVDHPITDRPGVKAVPSIIGLPGVRAVAERVCEKCSCHPLLINTIAAIFREQRDVRGWRAALKELDKRWREPQDDGWKELFSCLKLCYDQLQGDQHQKCFLYTSLYPANSKIFIDYLVECWMAHSFLVDVNGRRIYQNARDNGQKIITDLINRSFLEKGEVMYVTMNACMRQFAWYILSKHPQYNFYVYTDEESNEVHSSNWGNAKWVSMINTELHSLPPSKDCNIVETLLLQQNSKLSTIEHRLLENMRNLLVLDLYDTAITKLPSSLSNLTCLRGLYLTSCKHLRDLPPEIALLQVLEVLDIRGSLLSFVPSYIGSLTNLICLRISLEKSGGQSSGQGLNYANYHMISKLQNIEELIIEVKNYDLWRVQADCILKHVGSLEKLTAFNCSFPSSEILTSFMERWAQWRNGDKQYISFQFFIGCGNSQYPQLLKHFDYKLPKYLKYHGDEKNDDEAVKELIHETDAIELIRHKDIKSLLDLGIDNLNCVRGFLIENCDSLSTIVEGDTNGLTNGSILPILEQLFLRNLPNLEHVLKGCLPPKIFCKLHTLKLENCPKLESIFGTGNVSILPDLKKIFLKDIPMMKSFFKGPLHYSIFSKLQILALENCSSLETIGVIQDFAELQKLEIRSCSEIKELILTSEDIERRQDVLPSLKDIGLADLPKLEFICKGQMLDWPSLEILKVLECPLLKSLPFCKDNASRLRSIKGNQEWWNELGRENKDVHQQFLDIFVAVDS